MDRRSAWAGLAAAVGLVLSLTSCAGQVSSGMRAAQARTAAPKVAYANIGGYLVAYECAGTGTPTVILEAGYTASGIDSYGRAILPRLARRTRVCTYDRAGDGLSDPHRPVNGHVMWPEGEGRHFDHPHNACRPHVLTGAAGAADSHRVGDARQPCRFVHRRQARHRT